MTQFEFSVVMAVYNVEPFLREAIESVVAQDFGFEKIQLVLVDDGSTDGSDAICDEYAALYPQNVVALHKENGGVSSARNKGLEIASGKYVNFLDADDKLSENAMSTAHNFFESHSDETDVVAIPMMFFDGRSGAHPLNYRFKKGSRVIDLFLEPTAFQLAVNCSFVKAEAIGTTRFDTNLAYTEDGKFLHQILIFGKKTLGVVVKATYWYRKRSDGQESAIQGGVSKPAYYIPWMQNYCLETIRFCQEQLGLVPEFIQHAICYDLQWRVKAKIPRGVLSEEEIAQYKELIRQVLQHVEDKIILAQKWIVLEQKAYLLTLKHGRLPSLLVRPNNVLLHYENLVVGGLNCRFSRIDFLKIKGGTLFLEGFAYLAGISQSEQVEVFLRVNGNLVACQAVARHSLDACIFGDLTRRGFGFKAQIPLERDVGQYEIKLVVRLCGTDINRTSLDFGKFAPLSGAYWNSHYFSENWMVLYRGGGLFVHSYGRRGRVKQELKFLKELWKKNKQGSRKAFFARIAFRVLKAFKKKELWIISDRVLKADDNGEAFFKYVMKNHRKERKYYFAISKNSPDYARMKKIGKTVSYFSWRHKMLLLLADFNISAHADDFVFNMFGGYSAPYKDIMQNCKYVFLQHGIIKDDLSKWTNKYNKNFAMFVTAAKPEYDSIVNNGEYHYDGNVVKLTGLPRYDFLYRDEKKLVTIMPTWRANLVCNVPKTNGQKMLRQEFYDSEFFAMYKLLFQNVRLFDRAEELGYKIRFLPHPNLSVSKELYELDPRLVWLLQKETSYREVFAQSDLLVTDYSSIAFDFAYLRKPLLYYQADRDSFFEGQVYEQGYFDYEKDGFGEVAYNCDDLVEKIIEYMQSDCKLKDVYRKRIDGFFAFNDKNNCQRVYEEILKLEV